MSSKTNSILSRHRKDLLNIYQKALEAVKPDKLIKDAVKISGNSLAVKSLDQSPIVQFGLDKRRIHLIGGGKSVLSMACGLAELAIETKSTKLFSHGCLSLPIDLKTSSAFNNKYQNLLESIDVNCLFGSKINLPDEDSVRATNSILDNIEKACDLDKVEGYKPLFIVLISGGGSACLTNPRTVSLDQKLELTKFLVQRGASIIELNQVRRCLSNVKGGQLAMNILDRHPEAQVLSLILSDVIGDSVEYIASGPTCISSARDQKELLLKTLKKYEYPDIGSIESAVKDRATPASNIEGRVTNKLIGSNHTALNTATEEAKILGYDVQCLGPSLEGSTSDVVATMISESSRILEFFGPRKLLVIGGGETTVEKLEGESWGVGGRTQEMALDYMISRFSIQALDPQYVDSFMAGSTDGQDGQTDVAACMASYSDWQEQSSNKFDLNDALKAKKSHDSFNFWNQHRPDWLIKTGLTGTNVMDLYLLAVDDVNGY